MPKPAFHDWARRKPAEEVAEALPRELSFLDAVALSPAQRVELLEMVQAGRSPGPWTVERAARHLIRVARFLNAARGRPPLAGYAFALANLTIYAEGSRAQLLAEALELALRSEWIELAAGSPPRQLDPGASLAKTMEAQLRVLPKGESA